MGNRTGRTTFYPDLPKAYQTSQYDLPLCAGGYLDIEVEGQTKRIGITRIHIEEDAGKLIHDQSADGSLVDYNRCGVPLIEIVTEPDMRSPQEATDLFGDHQVHFGIHRACPTARCRRGSLRCDVNLSVRPQGQKEFGTRTEMKNINSFRAAVRAMESERARQIDLLDYDEEVVQETRRWDDAAGKSVALRSKEEAHDYRYFPEPDLVPIVIDEAWVEQIRSTLPELPEARKKRYMEEYNLPAYDAWFITASKKMAEFFDQTIACGADPKNVSNWIMGDISRILNEKELEQVPFQPEYLAKMIQMIQQGTISNTAGKKIVSALFEEPKDPEIIAKERNLIQVNDEGALRPIIEKIIQDNPQSVADFKAGKEKAMGFFVGQAMRASKGAANPQIINKLVREILSK